MTTSGLIWKLNRLRTMDPAEIGYRIAQTVKAKAEIAGIGRVRNCPPPAPGACARWVPVPRTVDVAGVRAAADRVLDGRYGIFALTDAKLGFPPVWNRDPRTGTTAPMVFGKTLDYRDPAVVGDIKYLWEPSRHLELVTLAQAWALTGEGRYAHGARTLLESWLDQCPYPLGVHWTSSLEHSVRLMNWSVAWQLLDGSPAMADAAGAAFARRWLDAVYLHQRFIAGHFSRHSSANNHLFGEYMGLFIGAVTWPCWHESDRWRRVAQSGLTREASKQNASDGVNREQGIWYHHEVADMMLLTGLAARAAKAPFEPAYWGRLEAMLTFLASVMDVAGHVPMFGDSDDAVMVRFDPGEDFCAYRSLLATGAVLFDRPDFAVKAGCFDDKSRWLLGDDAVARFESILTHADALACRALPRTFPEGGYHVMGHRLDEPDEVRIVADAGPLGYLSIAAHGHADALSFTLGVAGHEVLIDPGTYAYHTQRRWRDYFKGTSAHNTVRIDGQDQSTSGGNFMWLRHANARCESFSRADDQDRFVGEHDGYARLTDPVVHRREIVLDKAIRTISVTDRLTCNGPHEVELHWHLAEGCSVRLDGGAVLVEHGPVTVRMTLTGVDFKPEIVTGRDEPPLGWVSRRFDRKLPTNCVRWHGHVERSAQWVTRFVIEMSISTQRGRS